MDILLKCAMAAMITGILGMVIKKNNPENALLLAIGAITVILSAVLTEGKELISFLRELTEISGLPEGICAVVIKTVAVAVITGFVSEICKDAGQGALAAACETAGAITAVYMALPLLKIVLETMEKLL